MSCKRKKWCRVLPIIAISTCVAWLLILPLDDRLQADEGGDDPMAGVEAETIRLFRDNTTWTSEAVLKDDPIPLFCRTIPVGVEVVFDNDLPQGTDVSVRVSSLKEPANTFMVTLTKCANHTYRNTQDSHPLLYKEFSVANKTLCIPDEEHKVKAELFVGGVARNLSAANLVDAAEVAVLDATPSDDAKRFWDWTTDNQPAGTQWGSAGKRIWSVAGDREHITDDNCVDFGSKADMLYIAGHGLTSVAAVWGSSNDDQNHPLGIYQNQNTIAKAFQPSDIGNAWNNGELEWCVLAVCSQVRLSNPGNPVANDNAVLWIKAMPKVHMLLGYRHSAPSAPHDVNISGDFVARLENGNPHDHVHMAWLLANKGRIDDKDTAQNATAMVNFNNDPQNDDDKGDKTHTVSQFPTKDDPGNKYVYYWIDKVWDWGELGYVYPIRPVTINSLP
jgi:hypothetical protein